MMRDMIALWVAALVLGSSSVSMAQKPPEPMPDGAVDTRAEIEKSVQSYVDAYNAKDAKALAALWSAEGVYLDRLTGEQITGRDELEKVFAEGFESDKNSRLEVRIRSIEFVSPSVAMEEGQATVTSPDAEPILTEYTAVHVKVNGKWQIDRISEQEVIVPPSHYEHLKELEWMIGDWGDKERAGSVELQCYWARNNNFIIRAFTINLAGQVSMAGMQIIGWDPAKETIRSWTFDSDGGFNEGVWTKLEDRWTTRVVATLPDGRRASATSIMQPLDENSFRFQQIDRVVGEELLPNMDEIIITRADDPVRRPARQLPIVTPAESK